MTCQFFNGSMQLYDAFTNQSIFAGTSVEIKSFSANMGTGNSESSIELDLVYNQCSNIGTGNLRAGYAVIFVCNGFEFGGIVDKIDYNESSSGRGWKVRISDPRKLLDNYKLLLSGNFCNINLPNFCNVQYLLEGGSAAGCSTAYSAVPDSVLPNIGDCNDFGLGRNASGGTYLLSAIRAVQAGGPAPQTIHGGSLPSDLSPIIALASTVPYAITDSPSMSLLQLITEICDEAGYDFMVGLSGSTIVYNVINRRVQTNLNGISNLIDSYGVNSSAPTLVSSSYGSEVTYQPTKKVVIGDNVQYCKYGSSVGLTLMYLGDDLNGFPITADYNLLKAGVPVNINTSVLSAMGVPGIANYEPITETEILSLANMSTWQLYAMTQPNSLGAKVGSALFGNWNTSTQSLGAGLQALAAISMGDATGKIKTAMSSLAIAEEAAAREVFEVVYNWLNDWSNKYYGKQWLVTMPQPFCAKGFLGPGYSVEGSSDTITLSDEIADAGWIDASYVSDVIGLTPNTADMALFENNDGRIRPFVAFPVTSFSVVNWSAVAGGVTYGLDISKLPGDYYYKGGYVYVPATVDGKMYAGSGLPQILVKTQFIPHTFFDPNFAAEGLKALALISGPQQAPPGEAGISTTEFNNFSVASSAGFFSHICIPFKSNMYSYGPYYSGSNNAQAFVGGGTEVVARGDLNPWTYGSVNNMNAVGLSIANEGIRESVITQTGSMVLAELPAYSLGPINGVAGLVLGSVVVNFGESGATTTYNFQTFTQKFGNYSKSLSDNLKTSQNARKELFGKIRKIRTDNLATLNSVRKAAFGAYIDNLGSFRGSFNTRDEGGNSPGGADDATLSSLLFGFYPTSPDLRNFKDYTGIPGGGTETPVEQSGIPCQDLDQFLSNTQPHQYAKGQQGSGNTFYIAAEAGTEKKKAVEHLVDRYAYQSYAVMSLDAILTPVSIYGGGGDLPRLADEAFDEMQDFRNKPRPVMPPVLLDDGSIYGAMAINGYYLNPMLSSVALSSWDERASGSSAGFSIKYIAFGDDPTKLFNDTTNDEKQQYDDFRFNALRGPLMLQAWGYDTEGKPIPNYVDTPDLCSAGTFQKNGLYDKFMPEWQANPKTWPMGPIDLRWDRERGVWVSPPSEKIVVAQLLGDLAANGQTQAVLLNPAGGGGTFFQEHDVYGPEGEHITGHVLGARIAVSDFLGRKLCKGTTIYAYHYGKGYYLALETSLVDAGESCPTCPITATDYTATTATDYTTAPTDYTYTVPTDYTGTPYTPTDYTGTPYTPTDYTGTPYTTTYYPTYPPDWNIYCYTAVDEISVFDGDPAEGGQPTGEIINEGATETIKFCREGAWFWARWIDENGLQQEGQYSSDSGPYPNTYNCECRCVQGRTEEECAPTTPTTPYTPPPPTTPPCDVCDLLGCLEVFNQDGVLGISNHCLTIYPLTECPTNESTPAP